MKKDVEMTLTAYPLMRDKAKALRTHAELIRANMDAGTEIILDKSEPDSNIRAKLIEAIQEKEHTIFRLCSAADNLELQASYIESSINLLDSVEKEIIKKYFFEQMSLSEIADDLSFSYSWTHKLKARAVQKLIDILEDFE